MLSKNGNHDVQMDQTAACKATKATSDAKVDNEDRWTRPKSDFVRPNGQVTTDFGNMGVWRSNREIES